MRGRDCRKGPNGDLNWVRVCWGEHITAVEPAHAVSNDLCLLIRIERFQNESRLNLVPRLVSPEADALRWVQFGYQDLQALLPKVLGDVAKVVNSKYPPETENSVNQNDIHGLGS